MNPALWDSYRTDEINDKIRYWVDLWESMIDSLEDPWSVINFDLMNPHLLIRHIIDEIVFNTFQNADNRTFFKRQLEFFSEHDPATNKLFASDLALIRREFGGNRLAYLVQLCQIVDQAYSKREYLSELYVSMRSILSTEAWTESDPESIRVISQCMIVELLLLGYSLDSIKHFPQNIFDRSTGLYFNHGFPLALNEDDFVKDGKLDTTTYCAEVQSQVDGLSVQQRLDFLNEYFSPESNEVYFLYQIEGLKGDSLDITIGNVNLYSPKAKRYIKTIPGENPDRLRNDELFDTPEDTCFANAAVKVTEFDTPASETTAIAAIENALDFFRVFVSSDVPFSVMSNKFLRVSPDGEYWGGGERGRSQIDPTYKHFRALDLTRFTEHGFDEAFLSSAGKLLFEHADDGGVGQKLSYSLHWYRKAEEAKTPEDRLLSYWIVLENIVSVEKSKENVLLPSKSKETKFTLIRELIPSLECCLYLENAAAMLFQKLVRLLNTSTNDRPHLSLPAQVAADSMLLAAPGTQINLATFVDHLPDVADAIERKTIKDHVLHIHRLHSDIKSARDQIERHVNTIKEDLLLIYRFRNRIVHNAHYDNKILPSYIVKVKQYAGNAVRQVIHDLSTGREPSVERSLLRYYVQLRRIEEQLEEGNSVNFLEMDI
ncbi:MAG: hypothetical protein CME32_31545 [Gimesia sp.]|nr:hypothetical protein [Gimesia sp.]